VEEQLAMREAALDGMKDHHERKINDEVARCVLVLHGAFDAE